MTVTLRPTRPSDHRTVEALAREAFWGMSGPRCSEHLLVRLLRSSPAYLPELDVVAESGGAVVGHVVWTRARVVGPSGESQVLTFGPLSVLPAWQGRGVGATLMRHTMAEAARLGHRAVVVYGHPDYYPRLGFVRARGVGITAPGGATFDALMARALVPGGLDGVRGEFHEDPAFEVTDAAAEAFDAGFPPKEPAPPAPIEAMVGAVPADALAALRTAGIRDVWLLRRMSAAEVAAVPGVGPAGAAAVAAWLRARGIRWGKA